MNDSNFKIVLSSLLIINNLIKMEEFKTKQMLDIIAEKIIEKLGDSKIAIR